MSVFSLKIDIADNKFFNGETSPLFRKAVQNWHASSTRKLLVIAQHRFVRWTISQTCLV